MSQQSSLPSLGGPPRLVIGDTG